MKLNEWGNLPGLQVALKTSIGSGIKDTAEQKQQRKESYGDNKPIVKQMKTLLSMIIETFQDDMLRILCFASLISLILGIAIQGWMQGWMQGFSILIAIIIIVTVTSGNEYAKEKQFKKLFTSAEKKSVNVIRNGQVKYIDSSEVVVGDILQVQTGNIMVADGIVVMSRNLLADESSMTGQPIGIRKCLPEQCVDKHVHANAFMVSSSKIIEGYGSVLVCAVGQNSRYGQLKMSLKSSQNKITPLQQKLGVLADQIGKVGMWAAILTFLCMFLHILFGGIVSNQGFVVYLLRMQILHEVVHAFIIAVSIIVVAIPEGLPLSVTIALAYSVGKMKQQNNLVRYLQACQTMGGVDNICTDKTGTLTLNSMQVTKIFTQETDIPQIHKKLLQTNVQNLLSLSICINTNANPIFEMNQQGKVSKRQQIGNKTECALLQLALCLGYNYKQYRNDENIIKIFPFSSHTKVMTIISKYQNQQYIFTKGAPEILIEECTFFLDKNGKQQRINQEFRNKFDEKLIEYGKSGLRTLLLAYRQGNDCNKDSIIEEVNKDLIVLALVGIKDPLRAQIPSAIKKCNQGGVRVRMITGDSKITAIQIAKQAGILQQEWFPKNDDYTVMTGQQFRNFVGGLIDEKVGNLNNFKQVANQLKVLARSSPSDKYLMAAGLMQLNHVVAMTGDGTNDAPALKKADIGLAMGITGTDIAKQAADIILLDDNFNSIITAMKWGRNIFDSIRKFLQFQLTVNMVALVMAFAGAAILSQSPLNPIQMLWVNLIMDTLASLALATEPPNDQLLKRKPYTRHQGLITAAMWRNIVSQGMLQILILSAILFKGPQLFQISSSVHTENWNLSNGKHYCIFFNVFVLLQLFNEINCKKIKPDQYNVFKDFFNNSLFLFILLSTIVIQLLCVQFGGQSLKTVPLTLNQHLICLGLGSISLFAGVVFKLFVPIKLFQLKTQERKQE